MKLGDTEDFCNGSFITVKTLFVFGKSVINTLFQKSCQDFRILSLFGCRTILTNLFSEKGHDTFQLQTDSFGALTKLSYSKRIVGTRIYVQKKVRVNDMSRTRASCVYRKNDIISESHSDRCLKTLHVFYV